MSAIDDLISRITDENLRSQIQQEISKLSGSKKFGLVFEEHHEFSEAIYPGLERIDEVSNDPGGGLWHVLIEAENYHALQLLEYTCAGQADCIYIDPPYNTGARDWKYNNDYVDSNDAYRHSKWLSFMAHRLKLAKRLLKQDGVLIVAIDDNECARLTLLLEEIFPERKLFDVHIQHNPRGTQGDFFAVTHETAIFAVAKNSKIYRRIHDSDDEDISNFRKWGNQSTRSTEDRASTFYPVIVDYETLNIVGFDDVLDVSENPEAANVYHDGLVYVYPVDRNGTQRKWRYSRENAEDIRPFLKATRNRNGVIEIFIARTTENTKTIWTDNRYNAEIHGTKLVHKILGRNFPFPKSLYAVHDCLWHVVAGKPNATIIDFFAGSGTTLHAVNLLNAQDSGHRRCIMITNNEISDSESRRLTAQGYSPDSPEWQNLGIARHVTWPRTVCTISGHDINGQPLKGSYLDSDIPMSDGFRANAVFFRLVFSDRDSTALGHKFREILPVLWMKAGMHGRCPVVDGDNAPDMLILPENRFAVINNEKIFPAFMEEVNSKPEIETVFIAADSDTSFRTMSEYLNARETCQLYRDYLDNFRIKQARRLQNED